MSKIERIRAAWLVKPANESDYAFINRFADENPDITRAYAKKAFYGVVRNESANTASTPSLSDEWRETKDVAEFKGVSQVRLKNDIEVMEFTGADPDIWEIVEWHVKAWDTTLKLRKHKEDEKVKQVTNYGIFAKFKRKDQSVKVIQGLFEEVAGWKRRIFQRVTMEGRTGVVVLGDLHLGAEITNLIRTPDFNLEAAKDSLLTISRQVNSYNFARVELAILGDLFESLTGLMHFDQFRSVMRDGTGANIIKIAAEILRYFISQINNVYTVYTVGGNHDRITASSKLDTTGDGADILAHILKITMPEIQIIHHSFLHSIKIDGIHYVMHHGHKGIGSKHPTKILFEYGDNKAYNVLLSAHLHTRRSGKTSSSKGLKYEDMSLVPVDDLNYRALTVAPIFTGNRWSEEMGLVSRGGYYVIFNSGNGVPEVHDKPL